MYSKSLTVTAANLNSGSNVIVSVNSPTPTLPSNYPAGPRVVAEVFIKEIKPYTDTFDIGILSSAASSRGDLTNGWRYPADELVSKQLIQYWIPRRIEFVNASGVTINYAVLCSVGDEKKYIQDSTLFQGIGVPTGTTTVLFPAPNGYRILLNKASGSASGDVTINLSEYDLSNFEIVTL